MWGEIVFFFFFVGKWISADFSLLGSAEDDQLVGQLRGALEPLAAEAERMISSLDTARRYEEVYDRVTPYVLLPMPVGLSWKAFQNSGILDRIGHLIVAGRVKAFDIHIGDHPGRAATKRSAKWKRRLLGRAFHQPPVNGSPLKPRRFSYVFSELVSEIQFGLDRWSERFTLFADPERGHDHYAAPPTLGSEPPLTFFSYSSANHGRVSQIADTVAASGPQLWFDRVSIQDGEDWIDRIRHGLSLSERLVAFCSKDYYASRPCCRELIVFSGLKRPMLPVVLDGKKLEGVVLHKLYRLQYVPAAQLSDSQVAARILGWMDRNRRK